MAIPDISGLNVQELVELIDRAGQLFSERRSNAQSNLAGARAALDSLIGPDDPTEPSMTSLTEVQLYTDEQVGANLVLGLRLSFEATEQVARILRDVRDVLMVLR